MERIGIYGGTFNPPHAGHIQAAKEALKALQLDKMIIGTMKALLPGLALSKAMRDLLEGNLISGNSKVVEVLLNAVSIAGGVAIALTIFHMS